MKYCHKKNLSLSLVQSVYVKREKNVGPGRNADGGGFPLAVGLQMVALFLSSAFSLFWSL